MSGSRDKLLKNSPQEWPISLSCPPNAFSVSEPGSSETQERSGTTDQQPHCQSPSNHSHWGRRKAGWGWRYRLCGRPCGTSETVFFFTVLKGKVRWAARRLRALAAASALHVVPSGKSLRHSVHRGAGDSCYDTVRIQWESTRKLIPASGI